MFDHNPEISEFKLEKELYYHNVPILKYSICYPQITSNRFRSFINKLNQYYRYMSYSLAQYCEDELYKSALDYYKDTVSRKQPFFCFEFDSNFTVTYNENRTLSLYFDEYQYQGGANGTVHRQSNNWNLKSGRAIKLSELFNSKQYKIQLQKEIELQIAQNPDNYFSDYHELVAEHFNPKDFYLIEKAAVIYFQEITIAPHAAGIMTFEIPYSV